MKKLTGLPSLLSVLLIAFMSTGEGNGGVESHFVRATKYHKSDPVVDQWTARGLTSTRIRLPQDDRIVKNPNKIGNVAVDPRHIPEGSLVFETTTQKFFIATTGGSAVIDRRSARAISRMQNLCQEHYNALVFDFYYPHEIVDNHFTECFVIPHDGGDFRTLHRDYQYRRLSPNFWVERLEKIKSEIEDDVVSQERISIMLRRLRQMARYQNQNQSS